MFLLFKTLVTLILILGGAFCKSKEKDPFPTDEEYEQLANVDNHGSYELQKFVAINTQFAGIDFWDSCEDNYIKCLVSLMSTPTPICAIHTAKYPTGQFTFPSYCDMFFDNCRRGQRWWRLLGYGVCNYKGIFGKQFDIVPGDVYGNTNIKITRRFLEDWWSKRYTVNECAPKK